MGKKKKERKKRNKQRLPDLPALIRNSKKIQLLESEYESFTIMMRLKDGLEEFFKDFIRNLNGRARDIVLDFGEIDLFPGASYNQIQNGLLISMPFDVIGGVYFRTTCGEIRFCTMKHSAFRKERLVGREKTDFIFSLSDKIVDTLGGEHVVTAEEKESCYLHIGISDSNGVGPIFRKPEDRLPQKLAHLQWDYFNKKFVKENQLPIYSI